MVQHHDDPDSARSAASQGEAARAPGRNDEVAVTVAPAEEVTTESDNDNSGSKSRRKSSRLASFTDGFGYARRGSATSDSAARRMGSATLHSLGSFVMGRKSSIAGGDEGIGDGLGDKREKSSSMSPWRTANMPKKMTLDRQESMAVLNSTQLRKKGKRAISLMLGDMTREELAKLLATTEMEKLVSKVFAKYDAKTKAKKANGTCCCSVRFFFCVCNKHTPCTSLEFLLASLAEHARR
jgi:hypothetical protein